jgi:hypothetical protein
VDATVRSDALVEEQRAAGAQPGKGQLQAARPGERMTVSTISWGRIWQAS